MLTSLEEALAAFQLSSFRQYNHFFQAWENATNNWRYLGKYWFVLGAVKSIFFSETSSTRFMGDEFLANYSFNAYLEMFGVSQDWKLGPNRLKNSQNKPKLVQNKLCWHNRVQYTSLITMKAQI